MSDIKTKSARSLNMAAIKNRDTQPEVYLRHLLFAQGLRYRICSKAIPGHPDLWMKKFNTAVFVNGCFWHRHVGCKYAYTPKSQAEFWNAKFIKNLNRDIAVKEELERRHIRCLVVWECTIKNTHKKGGNPLGLVGAIVEFLNSDLMYQEL